MISLVPQNSPYQSAANLTPGCHVTSNQVAVTLNCGYERNYPLLTSLLALRGFIIGSFAFSSDDTHLLRSLSQFFLIAHHRYVSIICSIRWLKTTPESRLRKSCSFDVLKSLPSVWQHSPVLVTQLIQV